MIVVVLVVVLLGWYSADCGGTGSVGGTGLIVVVLVVVQRAYC